MYVNQYIAKEPLKTQEAWVCFPGHEIELIYKVNQIMDCFKYFDKYIDPIFTYSKNCTSELVRDIAKKTKKKIFNFEIWVEIFAFVYNNMLSKKSCGIFASLSLQARS